MAFEATDRNELRSKLEEYAETGDKELRDEIVASQVGLAEYLARRFKNREEPIEDLIQVALLGLLKAVERFDPGRGLEFSTFATPTIVGELKRHFRDKGGAGSPQGAGAPPADGDGGQQPVPGAGPLPHHPRDRPAGRGVGRRGAGSDGSRPGLPVQLHRRPGGRRR